MQTLPVADSPQSTAELSHCAALLAADLKALGVVVVDVRGHCSYADFLVICSGTSDRHVRAIAESVDRGLAARGQRVLGREGLREGQWALLDAGGVIVHVFHPFTRQLYDLEQLWQDCPREAHGPPAPLVDMGGSGDSVEPPLGFADLAPGLRSLSGFNDPWAISSSDGDDGDDEDEDDGDGDNAL